MKGKPMPDTRNQTAYTAYMVALNLIEQKANDQSNPNVPLPQDVDELALVASALVHIGAMLVSATKAPPDQILEEIRMLALAQFDSET